MTTTAAGLRRIVTFIDKQGRSRCMPEERAPRVAEYVATPGMRTSALWATAMTPTVGGAPHDPVSGLTSFHPVPGGSVFLTLTLPPDTVYAAPDFNPLAAAAEHARHAPGIADRMEAEAPGFHATDTLDYVIVLSGEIWLVLDEMETRLQAGDSVVQIGARHAWQNRSDTPATLAVVLLGAQPSVLGERSRVSSESPR